MILQMLEMACFLNRENLKNLIETVQKEIRTVGNILLKREKNLSIFEKSVKIETVQKTKYAIVLFFSKQGGKTKEERGERRRKTTQGRRSQIGRDKTKT